MKKKKKILIAFVVIVLVAVGVYFLFSGNNTNAQLYSKVNVYTYGIKDGDKNIVDEVDTTIEVMLNEINAKNFTLEAEKTNFETYLEIKEDYAVVQNQILNYGNFVTDKKSEKYLKSMDNSYNKLVRIYRDSYQYLKETYYEVDFATLSNATKITYIENFNVKIENIVRTYNGFMYNAGMVYAISAKNLINYNNCYKLRMSYYVTLINNSVNLSEENASLLTTYKDKINAYASVLTQDAVDTYMSNGKEYDKLIKNIQSLKINKIVENSVAGTLETYISGITKVETQQLVLDFVAKIING